MASIGSLIINVAANAKQMKEGLQEAQGMLDRFKTHVGGLFPGGDLLAAGGFGAGFAASSALVHQQTGAIAEQFKELQSRARVMQTDVGAVFDLKGLKPDQFEALAPAVANLQKELGQAVMNNQAARKQFDDLGLSWKELAESPLPAQLRAVANRIKEAETAAERMAIANALLGKSGKDLIPTLAQGADAFDKAASKQHRFISEGELLKAGAMEKVVKEETEVWGKTWDKAMEAARIKFRAWQLDVANYGRGLMGKDAIAPLAKETPGQLPFGPREWTPAEKAMMDDMARAAQDVLQMGDQLRRQQEQIRLGPDEAALAALQRQHGLHEDVLGIMRKEVEQTRELQRAFEQFTQRQGALAGLADQLEAFALGPTELAIQQLQELGASVEELVLAQEALDILGKANGAKGGGVNLPQALTAGSAEAVSFQNRAARAAENLNRQDDMAALKDDAKKVLEVLRDILKANKDVAKAVKDQNPIGEQNI